MGRSSSFAEAFARKIKNTAINAAMFARGAARRYIDHGVGKTCAALAYYFLFSVFPFLVFMSMLLGFLNLEPIAVTSELGALLPSGVLEIVNTYIQYVGETQDAKLLVFGLVFTMYFTVRAVDFLMQGVRHAYGVPEPHSFVKRWATGAVYTLFVLAALTAALVLIMVGGNLMEFMRGALDISQSFVSAWSVLRFALLAALLFILLSLLYRTAPRSGDRAPDEKRLTLPGTAAALLSWLAFSVGFAWYADNLASYSLLYGSLGTIIVLLLWLYFSAAVIVMGAEINALASERRNKNLSNL